MERYDIAIVGSGPAGLSAAITAKLRNKNIIVFGNDILSNKVLKAQEISNYLGLGVVSGEKMQENFADHLKKLDVSITNEKVSSVYNMGNYFGIQGAPDIYEASAVILATGVVSSKTISGEDKLLGKGVSYCATCDGMLYKNKTIAVVIYGEEGIEELEFLAQIAKKVYCFPMYKGELNIDGKLLSSGKVEIVDEKPTDIVGETYVEKLKTENNEIEINGVFILRNSIAPSQLISGIEMENNHVVVDRRMATNIPGCFACGDITGTPYQYIKSAGEGNVAALSAVSYLASL